MNECSNKLSTDEVKEFMYLFEKSLLEVVILDSLNGSSDISDKVKNVFRTCVEDLKNFSTLNTLTTIIYNIYCELEECDRKKELCDRCCSDDGQEYVLLEKKIETLKQKNDEIDSMIEKCTKDGELMAIRRETEKNYVDKWEKARVEYFKLKFLAEEIELQKKTSELQATLKTEKIIDTENEQFLDYSINELEKQIEYWEYKSKTDILEIDTQLQNFSLVLKEESEEVESLKKIYNERQTIIEEHEKNKQKLEEEKKMKNHREKMATKIQAWWRGIMVRRRLGPYKNLLGPRKKSIKKPMSNKEKKPKK